MTTDIPIAFFDPRLGELRGVLRGGAWQNASPADVEIELLEAELAPTGDVNLRVRFVTSDEIRRLRGLCATHEDSDGRLALELHGERFLVFDAPLQGRVRDVVLSLANRTTPYF
jgi:hypothetical protein